MFVKEEEEEKHELVEETKNHVVCISALEYFTKEMLNHVAVEELVPIMTHKKFHDLWVERFHLNVIEKGLLEKHLLKTGNIKYSKATITFDKGNYYKEYRVMRFLNLHELRVNKASNKSEVSNKITEFQVMLFELELNHTELK